MPKECGVNPILGMFFDVQQSCRELFTAAGVWEESHVSLLCAGWSVRRKDGRQKS